MNYECGTLSYEYSTVVISVRHLLLLILLLLLLFYSFKQKTPTFPFHTKSCVIAPFVFHGVGVGVGQTDRMFHRHDAILYTV